MAPLVPFARLEQAVGPNTVVATLTFSTVSDHDFEHVLLILKELTPKIYPTGV
jgi:hypothetical protein